MPHQCTDCGRQFDDGSKEMLSGCPECGGNKFEFLPATQPETSDRSGEPEAGADRSVVGNAATAVRDFVGDPSGSDRAPNPEEELSAPARTAASTPETENSAQASARSELVSPEELPDSPRGDEPGWPADDRPTEADADTDRPDLSELRAELNQQFESIKVLRPGQYELNLMELFDREEYIVALQEDGKYTVQVPENWKQ